MEYNEKSGFHLVLIFFYLLLLEISLIQLFRLIYNRHQIVSFQFGFLTISFIWCAERIFSLVFSPLISTELFQFLWVLPSFFSIFIIFITCLLQSLFTPPTSMGANTFCINTCIRHYKYYLTHYYYFLGLFYFCQ